MKEEDQVTKNQSKYAGIAAVSLVAGIATVAGIAQSVQPVVSILTGAAFLAVVVTYVIKYLKVS